MTMRKVVRGFTLLELVVVVCIVAVLMGTFMNRVLYYRERAEKTAMEGMAASIQSALTMRYGMILLHGQSSDLAALAKENPVNWLQKKPENYAGEFFDPTPGAVSPGNWLYDLKSGELIYVPASAYYLEPDKGGRKWVRFHVAFSQEVLRLASQQQAGMLTNVLFEPVEPYSWF